MRITGRNLLTAAAVAALLAELVGCAPSTVRPSPRAQIPYPSPLAGPGVPALTPEEHKAVEAGFRHLEAGQPAMVSSTVASAAHTAPARLLELESRALAGATASEVDALAELTATHPDYAAAWITLSQVAETTGDDARALAAATRGAGLWPVRPWRERAETLHQRLVDAPLSDAARLANGADPAAALPEIDAVLALEPESTEARLLKAQVLIATGQAAQAAPLIEKIDTPRARLLAGRIAEAEGDWTTAMDEYQALPPGTPGREEALARARMRWRISNLPGYVQKAIAAASLTRGQLAVLLVDLAPAVEGVPGGSSPLLSDIVDLPSYREVLVAVRTGLLRADLLEHRFYPERAATPRELREALSRLSQLLGVTAPTWCDGGATADCTTIPDQVSGSAATNLILALVAEAAS